MIYLLIDTLTYSLTGVYLCMFIAYIPYISLNNFIKSCLLFLVFSNDYYMLFILIIMYILDKLLKKYFKPSFKYVITLYSFYYMILNNIDIYYFINFIFVILFLINKYNKLGDNIE